MSPTQSKRRFTPTTRKRAEYVLAVLTASGDVHYQRWPERGALSKTRFDRPQSRQKYGAFR